MDKTICKCFLVLAAYTWLLTMLMCPSRPPVTWCPRGIKRGTWSWTRRLRLCAERTRRSWRDIRWGQRLTGKQHLWLELAVLTPFQIIAEVCGCVVLGGGGGQKKGRGRRNGIPESQRESGWSNHHNQQVHQCECLLLGIDMITTWLGPSTILYLFSLWFGSRKVEWWWQSHSAAVHQPEQGSRRQGLTGREKAHCKALAKGTGSS